DQALFAYDRRTSTLVLHTLQSFSIGIIECLYFGLARRVDRAELGIHLLGRHLVPGVISVLCPIETRLRQPPLENRRAAERSFDFPDMGRHLLIADDDAAALGLLPQQLLVDQFVQGLVAQALVQGRVADAGQRPAL